jgi:tRNA pseudouridine55 synthase
MGEIVGCPAHMRFLLREQTGAFSLDTAVTIEQLKQAKEEGTVAQYVLPMDHPLSHMPRMDVNGWVQRLCENGVTLRPEQWAHHIAPGEHTRIYAGNQFMGISRAEADGTLVPRVVLSKQEGSTN